VTRRVALLAIAALLAVATPARADIALTFDDGPESNYTTTAPLLLERHLPATFYIISGRLGPLWGHVTADQVRALAADGFDIGGHSVDHPAMATIPLATAEWELSQSQADLEALTGQPITEFSYPYGSTDPAVSAACLAVYAACRGYGGDGLNAYGALDRGDLRTVGVTEATPLVLIAPWIDAAVNPTVLLVLVFHDVGSDPSSEFGCGVGRLERIARYVERSGARVVTMKEALG
jgi:peptidoglycan/xylan/chitin deacetylase (PgdA/CDA1 family)